MNKLLSSLTYCQKTTNKLIELGITTTYKLLTSYPKYYDFGSLDEKKKEITILSLPTVLHSKTSKEYYSFEAKIDKEVKTFLSFFKLFNLSINAKYLVDYYEKNNTYVVKSLTKLHDSIKACYQLGEIPDHQIRMLVNHVLKNKDDYSIVEVLPSDFITKFNLLRRNEVIKQIHSPESMPRLNKAWLTLKYEDIFFMILRRYREYKNEGKSHVLDVNKIRTATNSVPFSLTIEQKAAINKLYKRINGISNSFSLINGDTGSGKTIVTFLLMNGLSKDSTCLFMAPSSLLSKQHYYNYINLFGNEGVFLLTSSTKDKKSIYETASNNQARVIFGTTSLLSDKLIVPNLELVIIDEQHKFGTIQRETLINKGHNPDIIYLSATPIPRTLSSFIIDEDAMIEINERPSGRMDVETFLITYKQINKLYDSINSNIIEKHKTILVVPTISSDTKLVNITKLYKRIVNDFKNTNVYMINGDLDDKLVEKTVQDFIDDEASILISTSMISEGIDIRDATLIGIFEADSFGLSTLHQLRGRVGRNSLQSKCFLIVKNAENKRLKSLEEIHDGREISKLDLYNRGSGDMHGIKQSGKESVGDWASDADIIKSVQNYIKSKIVDEAFLSLYSYYFNRVKDSHKY